MDRLSSSFESGVALLIICFFKGNLAYIYLFKFILIIQNQVLLILEDTKLWVTSIIHVKSTLKTWRYWIWKKLDPQVHTKSGLLLSRLMDVNFQDLRIGGNGGFDSCLISKVWIETSVTRRSATMLKTSSPVNVLEAQEGGKDSNSAKSVGMFNTFRQLISQ